MKGSVSWLQTDTSLNVVPQVPLLPTPVLALVLHSPLHDRGHNGCQLPQGGEIQSGKPQAGQGFSMDFQRESSPKVLGLGWTLTWKHPSQSARLYGWPARRGPCTPMGITQIRLQPCYVAELYLAISKSLLSTDSAPSTVFLALRKQHHATTEPSAWHNTLPHRAYVKRSCWLLPLTLAQNGSTHHKCVPLLIFHDFSDSYYSRALSIFLLSWL